ncbi:MAG: tRNA (adenosine(37)-N6)-threonylcarbamoyltransferase complex ATPase subunit type 1 TsaE [Egibacteraceae bacterium]
MTRELQLVSLSPAETRKIAATVAGALRLGDVVALTGELGAGKTCFVQGAAQALGVQGRVTSPSFILRREYHGHVCVLHLDVYRLSTLQEVLDVGYEDALDRTRVTFIEWGDAMSPLLPVDHLEVEFRLPEPAWPEPDPSLDEAEAEPRVLLIRAHGHDWARRITGLSVDLQRWRKDA